MADHEFKLLETGFGLMFINSQNKANIYPA
jgi:hypothetical protein